MNTDIEKTRQEIQGAFKKAGLGDRERKVIDYRFGLTDNIVHTLAETGRLFGVTRERIRQIEAKALLKIRYYLELKKVEQ